MEVVIKANGLEYDLVNYIIDSLDDDSYGRGELECIRETINNQSTAIGILCEILLEKDILALEDITNIVDKNDELSLLK